MNEKEFREFTLQLSFRSLKLFEKLPSSSLAQILGKQFVRSATSVGANYRAACRAKSTADFAHKLAIVEEEADESMYWLDLIKESGFFTPARIDPMIRDFNKVVAMVVKSIKTIKSSATAKPKMSASRSIAVEPSQHAKIQNPKSKTNRKEAE